MNHASAFADHQEAIEAHEFQMGAEAGRLAVTLDILTDALVLAGQHGVYCQSARQRGKPAMDVQIICQNIVQAKELVASVIELLRVAQRATRAE